MKKVKDPNRLRGKAYFGTTILGVTESIGAGLMTSFFMMYLTDYAGIGEWGAILGTTLLLFARLFDAVNDPIQGWIMDRAKVGKHGKYRPFLLLSVALITAGLIGLFALPEGLANSPVMICVWVIGFYLLYDMGTSFYAPTLLYRTMTLDPNERGKLLIGPRMTNMFVGMVTGGLISIVNAVNANFNNMHTAIAVTVSVIAIGGGVISASGLLMVKEKYHAPKAEGEEEKIKLTDIFALLKRNDALRIKLLDQLFSGFVWTFLFATMTYYVKWAYCADLTTGAVDTGKMGILSLLAMMLMFVPLVVGTFIAGPIMKKIGSPIKFQRGLSLVNAIACLLLFVLEITGILRMSPLPFFLCAGVVATSIGAGYIPGATLTMECMDYEIYKNGKDRSALCNAGDRFLSKAQSAISSSVVGAILVAIGYQVDSVTDTFLGELSAIPTMLVWFIVIMGLIPGILSLISFFILKKYPVTDEIRADMKAKLGR